MKPQSCSFWLRKSGVPLFMWCQRRQRLPPTSLERGVKSGTGVQVVATKIWCSTVDVGPEETAFATYKPRARVEIRHSCSGDGCRKTAAQSTGSSATYNLKSTPQRHTHHIT